MSDFDIQNLLAPLEDISFWGRWKSMMKLGRQSMQPPVPSEDAVAQEEPYSDCLRASLVSLATSEVHYKRMLAAMSFRGMVAEAMKQKRQPPPDVVRALEKLMLDTSKIFKLVATPLVQVSTDEALKEILIQVSIPQFTVLNKAILKCGKSHIMHDLCIEQKQLNLSAQNEKGDRNLSAEVKGRKITSTRKMDKLYAYLSEEELKNLPLNDLFALPDEVFHKLTVLHPELMVEILVRLNKQLKSDIHDNTDTDTDPTQIYSTNISSMGALDSKIFVAAAALGALSHKKEVDLGMKLMKETLCASNLHNWRMYGAFSIFIHVRTLEMYKWIFQFKIEDMPWVARIRSRRIVKRLQSDTPFLVELYKMGWFGAQPLNILSSSVRHSFYKEAMQYMYVGKNNNVVPMDVACHIPSQALREKTARQMFHLEDLQISPETCIEYLSLLPFHEARKLCHPYLTNPKPELRRTCVDALIKGVAYYPSHLTDVLSFIMKQMKEQDPWRTQMFESLAQLPTRVWKQPHLNYIDKLIQASFDARDVSDLTLSAAQKLLVRIAEVFPLYAAEKTLLFLERGAICIRGLDKLSNDSAEKFLAVIFPKVKELTLKGDLSLLVEIEFQLGLKPNLFKTILRPIYDCYMDQDNLQKQDAALHFYYNMFRYETIHKIVPDILRKRGAEPGGFLIKVICSHEQGELLNFCLQSLRASVDSTDSPQDLLNTQLIHLETVRVHCWTEKQQRLLAEILFSLFSKIDSPQYYNVRKLFYCVTRLPSITIDDGLRSYVQEDQKDIFLRDTALFSLRYMNDAASQEELKSALQDSRAREATTALTSRLKFYPVHVVIGVLSSALKTCKLVSSQKHLIRFLGLLADETALDLLLRLWKEDACMHDDVKIAMQDAFRNYLNYKEIWDFYSCGAVSSRSAECVAVLSISDNELHYNWQVERMNEIVLTLLQNQDIIVQMEALKRLSGSKVLGNRYTFEEAFNFLSYRKSDQVRLAVNHILHYPYANPEELADRLAGLQDDRDLTIAVEALVGQYPGYPPPCQHTRFRRVADGLYKRLIAKLRQPMLICKLMLFGSADLLESRIVALIDENLLHPGAAVYVITNLSCCVDKDPLVDIQSLEKAFRGHSNPFLRRCGLAMLQDMAFKSKWPLECREALELYCKDSDLWIRSDAALVIVPSFEEASNDGADD